MTRVIGQVWINGVAVDPADATVSVFDIGFQRGYGCFEAMRSYNGVAFRQAQHLARLERSADNLRIPIDEPGDIARWCTAVARSGGDGVLRVFVTGGRDMQHLGSDNSVIVFLEELPSLPESFALDVIEAPWHPDGRTSELTGAKTLSYGPNLAATIAAKAHGFDDAVLVGSSGSVLEGPTFSIGWVADGAVYTPSLDANILESVTRAATVELAGVLGIEVREGRFSIDELLASDEVFILSTVREVAPVRRVGDVDFPTGPLTVRLKRAFSDLVAAETT